MGGKATDSSSNTGYTGGLTPYAQNLFGGSGSGSTSTNNGPTGLNNLGQQIMKASNACSASQGGPTEQAVANIGNALVNKFASPQGSPPNPAPNLFGGPTPTFTPQTPITSPMSTGLQMHSPITSPMFNPGSTGFQVHSPITSPMSTPSGVAPGTPMQTSSPLQSFSPANRAPTLFG